MPIQRAKKFGHVSLLCCSTSAPLKLKLIQRLFRARHDAIAIAIVPVLTTYHGISWQAAWARHADVLTTKACRQPCKVCRCCIATFPAIQTVNVQDGLAISRAASNYYSKWDRGYTTMRSLYLENST